MMMGAMKSYFAYRASLRCGIPSVTLVGRPEDWRDLVRRVDKLLEFDNASGHMKAWHAMLVPVLDKLASQVESDVADRDFWSNICHQRSYGSGRNSLFGWITVFSAFSEKGQWLVSEPNEVGGFRLLIKSVAPGYCQVPVKIKDGEGEHDTMLFAGSFTAAVTGGDARNALRPCAGWFIGVKQ